MAAGRDQTARVVRDEWGVPHITAASDDDLFFAQGYVMAQDRLWQLEMWRRQPDVYLNPGMGGIFGLFLHQLRPMQELVEAAVARMRLIPGNLEDGKRNLRPEMVPGIFLDRAANQARAGARFRAAAGDPRRHHGGELRGRVGRPDPRRLRHWIRRTLVRIEVVLTKP